MGLFGFGKKEKDKMKNGLEKTRTGFWGSSQQDANEVLRMLGAATRPCRAIARLRGCSYYTYETISASTCSRSSLSSLETPSSCMVTP